MDLVGPSPWIPNLPGFLSSVDFQNAEMVLATLVLPQRMLQPEPLSLWSNGIAKLFIEIESWVLNAFKQAVTIDNFTVEKKRNEDKLTHSINQLIHNRSNYWHFLISLFIYMAGITFKGLLYFYWSVKPVINAVSPSPQYCPVICKTARSFILSLAVTISLCTYRAS